MDDGIHFAILAQAGGCPCIHTRYVDDGLLRVVQHLRKCIRVTSLIELVAYLKILQIFVAIELLIVVVGNGMEPCFIFRSQHRHPIAPEVTARHRQDMCIGMLHQATHHFAQSAFGISTGVVELVDAHQRVVEVLRGKFLEGIAKRSVCTYQGRSFRGGEKLLKAFHLARFVHSLLASAEIEVRSHRPICKEAELLQFRILERTADTLFGYGHNGLSDALLRHLVEGDKHHGTALARCRRCFHQQVLLGSCLIYFGLHFTHTEGIGSR